MQNTILIRIDPRRGGTSPISFRRCRFRLYSWASDEIELWISPDEGVTWQKVDNALFRACWDPSLRDMRVSLLFDIVGRTHLAFVDVDGDVVGVGFAVGRYHTTPLGWQAEGAGDANISIGWVTGRCIQPNVHAGFTVFGKRDLNFPVGYILKDPILKNLEAGWNIALPKDGIVRVGWSLGTVHSNSVELGATLMGLSEFQINFISFSDKDLASMPNEVAVRKQKLVTLKGFTPEVLD